MREVKKWGKNELQGKIIADFYLKDKHYIFFIQRGKYYLSLCKKGKPKKLYELRKEELDLFIFDKEKVIEKIKEEEWIKK